MEILKIYLQEQLLIQYDVIKHLILLKIRNMMVINVDLLQWFIKILIKKSSNTQKGTGINSVVSSENKQLAEELHKPIVRKFEKRKIYSSFKDSNFKN